MEMVRKKIGTNGMKNQKIGANRDIFKRKYVHVEWQKSVKKANLKEVGANESRNEEIGVIRSISEGNGCKYKPEILANRERAEGY
jgi:hypothetical protein